MQYDNAINWQGADNAAVGSQVMASSKTLWTSTMSDCECLLPVIPDCCSNINQDIVELRQGA